MSHDIGGFNGPAHLADGGDANARDRRRAARGRTIVCGAASLQDRALATYDTGAALDRSTPRGFVQLWGPPLKIVMKRDRQVGRADPAVILQC